MKAAMIGLGMVSKTFGDAFANCTKVELSLIHARTAQSRRAYLDTWPGPAEATLEEIADSDVDFVVLATPPNARMDIVRTLAAAGKPILMEKPVERDLARAAELVELCEDAGIPLGIVFQHRARPVVAELRAAMPSLGPMMAVEVNVPWWRPQSYYDEPGRGTFARDGGGVMISQAIHVMDLMLSLTGPVSEITAMTATTGLHEMESEDFVSAGLRFANGAVGTLFATTASFPGKGEAITLHFRDGSARLERGVLEITRQDGSVQTTGNEVLSGAGADPMAFTSDWHRFVIEDFADALRDDRPPLVTGRDALEVHRLIAGAEASARSGQKFALKDL